MASHHEEEVLGKAYDSRLMKRLLTYMRPYRWRGTVAVISIALKAIADVIGPLMTLLAMDKYLAPTHEPFPLLDRWLSQKPLTGIAQVGGLYVALILFSFLLEYLQTYLMQWAGQMVMFDLRSEIFRHLQRMHIGFYDKNPVGRLVTRVTTDVDALNEMFTSGVVSIFEDVFVLAGILTVMLCVNWKLALITFAVVPLIFTATNIFRNRVRDSYRRIRVAIARINAHLQEHVSGIVVLQLFNREERAFDAFSEVNAQHMEAFKDAIMAHAVYYPVVEVLSSVAIACVIWFGGRGVLSGWTVKGVTLDFAANGSLLRIVNNAATLGVLSAFIQYAQRFFRPIQDLSEKYNILQSAMAAAERVFKLLDTPAEIQEPPVTTKAEGPGRIEFDHVWFAYRNVPKEDPSGTNGDVGQQASSSDARPDGRGRPSPHGLSSTQTAPTGPDWVLRDVSFVIEPSETAAIVGHTGAGKTTLISLLLRFYDVQRGAIRIDGVDIKQMALADLRRRFGVVLQDPFLFTGTIEGNIRLGTDWISDEQVRQAAEDVNLSDFIHNLPNTYKEEVRERGSTLSTGQKQLISFARALAHAPKILILDEATSSVDTETEFKVRDALGKMVEGRTSIVIAHRLSTVQRADKIIVMHKSELREMGTHQELLAQRGIYYKLYQLQYKDQELGVVPSVTAGADD
ncbi:MAG: antibiotic ABC transporter ATP-binding protein [Acidobacteria bacterium]|nr:MAG: antibiotic ABC transporter ATP-binding protein [Acidobacteriota bacterium]